MKGKMRYEKELQKTYVIAEECHRELIESYSGQMILRSQPTGLVCCEMHLIDGRREIWYDISFLQTVEQVFAVKELRYPALKNMIGQILRVIEETEKYLVDSRQLSFEPEYLYWDMEKEQPRLLYNYTEEQPAGSLGVLAAFLLEHICHEDEKAVDLAYYFYEQAQKENLSVEEIEAYLEKEESEKKEDQKEGQHKEGECKGGEGRKREYKAEKSCREIKDGREETDFYGKDFTYKEDLSGQDPRMKEGGKTSKRESFNWGSKNGRLMETGLACLIMATISGVCFALAGQYFLLEKAETLLWLAGTVLVFVAGLLFLAYGLLTGRKAEKPDKGKSGQTGELGQGQENESFLEELAFWQQEESMDPENTDGKTVYMGSGMKNREYRLIEIKKDSEKEYKISRYPFLIGKDKERVNLPVRERSVSRIHARLTQEEGVVYLEDLHSMNGTYLNDLLLEPHTKIKLKRGDTILFGRAEFIFR